MISPPASLAGYDKNSFCDAEINYMFRQNVHVIFDKSYQKSQSWYEITKAKGLYDIYIWSFLTEWPYQEVISSGVPFNAVIAAGKLHPPTSALQAMGDFKVPSKERRVDNHAI